MLDFYAACKQVAPHQPHTLQAAEHVMAKQTFLATCHSVSSVPFMRETRDAKYASLERYPLHSMHVKGGHWSHIAQTPHFANGQHNDVNTHHATHCMPCFALYSYVISCLWRVLPWLPYMPYDTLLERQLQSHRYGQDMGPASHQQCCAG